MLGVPPLLLALAGILVVEAMVMATITNTTATVWAMVGEHVFSFVVGLIVGFVLTNRYRLVKRTNGEPAP